MLDLVPRFYDPVNGSIKIDDTDIRFLKRSSLLDQIAIVCQQTFLFNRSFKDNILCGRRDASTKEIEDAAKAANIHDYIINLPMGYDTVVGEQGVKLSGGQKQRVSIARAILADKKILVLDEATSALDSETEFEIQKDLEKLMEGRTSIVIAHRLSTIMKADTIVVMDEGKIVEKGTHRELISKDGEYSKLWNFQKGGFIQ